MTNNNSNIIRISLDNSENSSYSLPNSEKIENQINIGTTNDNVQINKNEEKKILEEGNDKAPKGEGSKGINIGKSHDEEEKNQKNNLEGRQKENFGSNKEKKDEIFEITKDKKNVETDVKNVNNNKSINDEEKKLVEGKDGMPKYEASRNEIKHYRKSNEKKEKHEMSEKDNISTNNMEKRQNKIFEIITPNNISQFCHKNYVINSQGGVNTDNYPTFQNKNINELGNDKSKFIFICKIYFNYSRKNEDRLQFNKRVLSICNNKRKSHKRTSKGKDGNGNGAKKRKR